MVFEVASAVGVEVAVVTIRLERSIEERRLRFLGHVCRFIANPSSLLWFKPRAAVRRLGQGHKATYSDQLLNTLGRDLDLTNVRDMASGDKPEYTAWYTSRCAHRWNRWTHNPTSTAPADPPCNNAVISDESEFFVIILSESAPSINV